VSFVLWLMFEVDDDDDDDFGDEAVESCFEGSDTDCPIQSRYDELPNWIGKLIISGVLYGCRPFDVTNSTIDGTIDVRVFIYQSVTKIRAYYIWEIVCFC
jgi:hypothetical protein